MSFWRSGWTRLLVSHVVAGLIGVGAGAAYASKVLPTTRAVLHSFARRPVLDAAHIAFRFGPAEHARATLESVLRLPVATDLEWGDTMTAELRLAVLDGEFGPGAKQSHLDAARAACRRLKGSDCAPEHLRVLAVKYAHDRRAPPLAE